LGYNVLGHNVVLWVYKTASVAHHNALIKQHSLHFSHSHRFFSSSWSSPSFLFNPHSFRIQLLYNQHITMSFQTVFLAATAIFASANAHVLMKSPVPYSVDKLDNSPISKSQFPCKSQNGFTISTMNQMAAGTKQTLELSGSAVHGGGSCQLSVTLDMEPTANSVFKVIKSMEGGCPGVDSQANAYDFELPTSIPNGKATFAWTWFSKLSGQPELYMNCAPIEVTGGASDKSAFEALPNMLVANLDKSCESVPNTAIQFPDPGSVVQKGSTNDLKAPTGSSCGASGGSPPADGSPSAQPSSPAGQPSSAPQPSSPPGQYTPAPQPTAPSGGSPAGGSSMAAPPNATAAPPSNPGGVFAPGASGAPTQTSTTLVTVTGAPTAAQPTVPASPGTATPAQPSSPSTGGGSGAPSSPSTGGGSGTSCSTNGAIVCNGEKQFGLCNNGNVVWQDVASGTACTNGVVSRRSINSRVRRYVIKNGN
jgi:hypothetical protein